MFLKPSPKTRKTGKKGRPKTGGRKKKKKIKNGHQHHHHQKRKNSTSTIQPPPPKRKVKARKYPLLEENWGESKDDLSGTKEEISSSLKPPEIPDRMVATTTTTQEEMEGQPTDQTTLKTIPKEGWWPIFGGEGRSTVNSSTPSDPELASKAEPRVKILSGGKYNEVQVKQMSITEYLNKKEQEKLSVHQETDMKGYGSSSRRNSRY